MELIQTPFSGTYLRRFSEEAFIHPIIFDMKQKDVPAAIKTRQANPDQKILQIGKTKDGIESVIGYIILFIDKWHVVLKTGSLVIHPLPFAKNYAQLLRKLIRSHIKSWRTPCTYSLTTFDTNSATGNASFESDLTASKSQQINFQTSMTHLLHESVDHCQPKIAKYGLECLNVGWWIKCQSCFFFC